MDDIIESMVMDKIDDDDDGGGDSTEKGKRGDNLSFFVHVMIAISALFAAGISYTASVIDASFIETQGILATLNLENTRVINEARSGQNYSVYTYYAANEELRRLLESDVDTLPEDEQGPLLDEMEQVGDLAFINRFFFPGRYLEADGSYDQDRELAERFAEASLQLDLDPEPHFALANALDGKALNYGQVFILLAATVSLYAMSSLFHLSRLGWRVFFAVLGTFVFSACIAATVLIEMRG